MYRKVKLVGKIKFVGKMKFAGKIQEGEHLPLLKTSASCDPSFVDFFFDQNRLGRGDKHIEYLSSFFKISTLGTRSFVQKEID